ncbi:MAG: efflux RND transporter periplasmic adaptor subunit [Candidatus Binatia bacterium]
MRKIFAQPRRLIFGIIALGMGCIALGASRARGVRVDVVPIRAQPLLHTILASGRIMSPARVEIGSVITGRVEQVFVREGDRVEAGQILMRLESNELVAALRQAEASERYARARVSTVTEVSRITAEKAFAQAQTTLDWTTRELRRGRDLFTEGIMSQAKFEDLERAHEIARSQFEAARIQMDAQTATGAQTREVTAKLSEAVAARQLAHAKLAQASIVASAPGTVLIREVEPGDIVQPGRTLLTLASSGETRISAHIDEKNLPYLAVGDAAVASADAFPNLPFAAELYYLAPSIDVARGTVEARFRVPEPPSHLRADMTVSVEIRAAQKDQAIVVPSDALRGVSNGRTTVLKVEDGKAVSQPVTVGLKVGNKAEILQGVQVGEQVIMNRTVSPGTRVRPRFVTVEPLSDGAV